MKKTLKAFLIGLAIGILIVSFYSQIKHDKRNRQTSVPNEQTEYRENVPSGQTEVVLGNREQEGTGSGTSPLGSQGKSNEAMASWYDRSACGQRIYGETCLTANGEIFDEEALTFAHKTLPFGTRVRFCYLNVCVVAHVTDRGPYVVGRDFDFSRSLFESLANLEEEVITVDYEIIR